MIQFEGLHFAVQVFHRIDHLAEGMPVIRRIVLKNLLIPAPGRHVHIPHAAVVRQVPCLPMTEAHNGFFRFGRDRIDVFSKLQVFSGAEAELNLPSGPFPIFLYIFIKMVIRVIHHHGRCTGKIGMGPGIRKYMHGHTDSLKGLSLCQIHGVRHQCPVIPADQAVFVPEVPVASLNIRIEIIRKKMEGCPDPGDIRNTGFIQIRIRHLHRQLRGGRCCRSLNSGQKSPGTVIGELCAVCDLQSILMAVACQNCGAVSRIVMKIKLHPAPPPYFPVF